MEKLRNGVCSEESVDGSCDVWSCKDSDSSSVDHLVVMVHGILGSIDDWKFGSEQFVRRLPDKVFVHCSEQNASKLTLDGVDVMGERLASEFLEVIQKRLNIRKISFVAHSMGGLAARYAIGRLYTPVKQDGEGSLVNRCEESSNSTICGLEAMDFITVATPHLGSRGTISLWCYCLEKAASLVVHWIFRRAGRHLFLTDEEEGKPPLLRCMVEDFGDCYFMSALHAFKRRVVFSNVGYDHIVGWKTSSIRRDSELPKWEDNLNEKYLQIVYEEHCKACEAENVSTGEDGTDKVEEVLVKGLSRVSWEKVDVSFHSSRQRFAAHNVMQVKDQIMHMEGTDVIEHMIDHFLS